MGVEIAGLGRGIEDRTGIGVEGLFKELDLLLGSFVLEEDACAEIAGEERRQVFTGGSNPGVNTLGFGRGLHFGLKQTFPEALGIECGDLENAMAAWRAARMAKEVRAGAQRGGGEGSIHNLNKLI